MTTDEIAAEAAKEISMIQYREIEGQTVPKDAEIQVIKSAIEKATEVNNARWRDSLNGKLRFCPCNEPASMHGFDEHLAAKETK